MAVNCPIGGRFERFGDRADLWLWHAPTWFWRADHGRWPNGASRSGNGAPFAATLYLLWRRVVRREEVTWWGYADDVGGYPKLREEPLSVAAVYRTSDGLLSHGADLYVRPRSLLHAELWLREMAGRYQSWRWRQAQKKAALGSQPSGGAKENP